MALYRKKPVEVEAHPWNPDGNGRNKEPWPRTKGWAKAKTWKVSLVNLHLWIDTKEGAMRASPGDFIIRGVRGEFYPCKPEIFRATYEPAD